MAIKVSADVLSFMVDLDEVFPKVKNKLTKFEADLYNRVLKIVREINELTGVILDIDELSITLNLHEFEGQF